MFDGFMQTLTGPCSVKQGDSVLVCVSGGIDSMVLLELMKRASKLLRLRIGAIHIDHGIRMADSANDARFVLQYCKEISIESHLKELDMNPNTPNIEEEARNRRYAAILECKKKENYLLAATGHTLDDQAETILYRIIRGTGIRGLAGIPYTSPEGLIRPMRDISRKKVEDFAQQEGIRHVLDKTNDDLKYSRNLIRHSIISIMELINPRVVQAVARLSQIAKDEGDFVEQAARQLEKDALLFDWGIIKGFSADSLKKAPDTLTRRLIINSATGMLEDPRGIDELQVNTIMGVLKGKTVGHTIKRKVTAGIDGTLFVFRTAVDGPYYHVQVNHTGSFPIPEIHAEIRVSVPMQPGDDLEIRSFMRGDRIGKRRVSEILSGMGVPASLRPFWPVLVSGKHVIAAASRDENNAPSDMIVSEYYGK
jgi:tRNA(Ile)-lysidine synthetase-like protein